MNELQQIDDEPTLEVVPIRSESAPESRSEAESEAEWEPGLGVDATIAELRQEVAKDRRRQQLLVFALLGLPVAAILLAILLLLLAGAGIGSRVEPQWLFALLASIGPLVALYILSTRKQRSLAREVAQYDAVEAVGPLIDSLLVPDERVRREVMDALARTLPRLDAAAARSLTAEQVKTLNTQLSRASVDPLYYSKGMDGTAAETDSDAGAPENPLPVWRRHTRGQNRAHALLIEVIRAAPSFGNHDTLKWLDRLGRKRPRSRRRAEVARAAWQAAERLRGSLDQNLATASLLRPAGAPEENALLRPASTTATGNENTLLRPRDNVG